MMLFVIWRPSHHVPVKVSGMIVWVRGVYREGRGWIDRIVLVYGAVVIWV